MDREKVKLIVQNMESLIRILKQELEDYSINSEENDLVTPIEEDYDEVF